MKGKSKTRSKDVSGREKFIASVHELEHALTFLKEVREDSFYLAGITKSFETCLEYAWKYLKRRAIEEGLDPYSPKEAIKLAGRLGLIDDVEAWLDFLEDRNLSVHDYLGISAEIYLKTIQQFFQKAKQLVRRSTS